jgi:hypothetical protein
MLLAQKPYVPRTDPVDGKLWRGDQFYSESVFPRNQDGTYDRDGVFEVDMFRWGFAPPQEGSDEWQPRFARTRINTSSAFRTTYLLNPFKPRKIAGHAALLVEFAEKDAITNLETGETSQGLVLSIEARFEHGQGFGFLKSYTTGFPLIFILSTKEDFEQRLMDMYQEDLELYVMDVDVQESHDLAQAMVNAALIPHRDRKYNLTRASCVTALVDVMNKGLHPGRRLKRKYLGGLFVNLKMSFPAQLPKVLSRRGLIRERLPDMIGTPPGAERASYDREDFAFERDEVEVVDDISHLGEEEEYQFEGEWIFE